MIVPISNEKVLPHHQHDCESCVFLGHLHGIATVFDLYHCDGFDPSYIARDGSEGSHYSSTPKDIWNRFTPHGVSDEIYRHIHFLANMKDLVSPQQAMLFDCIGWLWLKSCSWI